MTIKINFERLKNNIVELSKIGLREDRGIYRQAFSKEDMEARKWLIDKIESYGLESSMDGAGNVYAKLKGNNGGPSVLTGSHLDTVPMAGSLDGALGVLCSLECLQTIQENNISIQKDLELVAFSDEEGRFGGSLGSLALSGQLVPDQILTANDLDGILLKDIMSEHEMDPMAIMQARRREGELHGYVELHIEQGPVLDRKGISIGIVETIVGLFKWKVRLKGNPDHAGTTPMPMRKDAFLGLAEFAGELDRILEENGSERSVATIGRVELQPGSANTVPGSVVFTLDVRDPEKNILFELGDAVRKSLSAIARRRDLMFDFSVSSEIDPVNCSDNIIASIESKAKMMQIPFLPMVSGALHDAQNLAGLTDIGMIFVPSVGGKSHSPSEWTHWEDIEQGANLLLNVLLELAGDQTELTKV